MVDKMGKEGKCYLCIYGPLPFLLTLQIHFRRITLTWRSSFALRKKIYEKKECHLLYHIISYNKTIWPGKKGVFRFVIGVVKQVIIGLNQTQRCFIFMLAQHTK